MNDQITADERGLAGATFTDLDGKRCEIYDSSLAEQPALRLGVVGPMTRMHLAQSQVREMLPALQRFAATGSIALPADQPLPLDVDEDTILALAPDRETDALLAVHIFGWRWLLDPLRNMIGLWPLDVPGWECWNLPVNMKPVSNPQDYQRYRDWHSLGSPIGPHGARRGLPRWSSTFEGMGEVITALRVRSLYWTGNAGFAPDQPAYAGFGEIAPSGHGWTQPDFQAVADTLPLATARAALLASRDLRHGAIQITAKNEVRHAHD